MATKTAKKKAPAKRKRVTKAEVNKAVKKILKEERARPSNLTFREQFNTYVRSGFSIMAIRTTEVERATEELEELTHELSEELKDIDIPEEKKFLKDNGFNFFRWDVVNGIRQVIGDRKKLVPGTSATPTKALRHIADPNSDAMPGVYVFENIHLHFSDRQALPQFVQYVREVYETGRRLNRHVIFLGSYDELPKEIQTYIIPLDYRLPTKEQIYNFIVKYLAEQGESFPDSIIRDAATAATGMTLHEVESAVCVAIVASDRETISAEMIFEEKAKAVMRSGLMEHMRTDVDMSKVGGMATLKKFFDDVSCVFTEPERAEAYRLPPLKGCLIVGVQGAGKTLAAKAVASRFRIPLFRLDVGRLFGGVVGSTEEKVRFFFLLAESVAPGVILIDEMERGFSTGDGSTDGGITDRMIGNFLHWMQEKTVPIYIVATANDINSLPAALIRRGRWDEMFFVDIPSPNERIDIMKIQLENVGRDVKNFKWTQLKKFVSGPACDDFTGAEIENGIQQAMVYAFARRREFTYEDVVGALKSIRPLARIRADEINAIRKWARENAQPAGEGTIEGTPKGEVSPFFWSKGSSTTN